MFDFDDVGGGGVDNGYDSPPLDANSDDVTKDSKEHLCPECGKVFKSQKLLKYHINEHEGKEPYQCDQCDFRSASKFKVRGHKKMKHKETSHLRVGGVDYDQCSLCPEPNTKHHMKRNHDEGLEFSCTYDKDNCSFKSCSEKVVQKHASKFHPGAQVKVQCELCPCKFIPGNMSRHMKDHHDPSLPFECDECQYRSGTAASIVQHKRICHHVGERVECYKGRRKQQAIWFAFSNSLKT